MGRAWVCLAWTSRAHEHHHNPSSKSWFVFSYRIWKPNLHILSDHLNFKLFLKEKGEREREMSTRNGQLCHDKLIDSQQGEFYMHEFKPWRPMLMNWNKLLLLLLEIHPILQSCKSQVIPSSKSPKLEGIKLAPTLMNPSKNERGHNESPPTPRWDDITKKVKVELQI